MTLEELKTEKAELRMKMNRERRRMGSIDPETFIEYNEVIRDLRRAESRLLKPIVISLILLILSLCGCAKMLEGSGRIIEGMGDGIVAGGIHLQESSSSKD